MAKHLFIGQGSIIIQYCKLAPSDTKQGRQVSVISLLVPGKEQRHRPIFEQFKQMLVYQRK